MKLITLNIETIKGLCAKYHVKSLFAFGSVTRDELKPNSDIDLVVDIDCNDPLSYSLKLWLCNACFFTKE